jgi:hypothetical protein
LPARINVHRISPHRDTFLRRIARIVILVGTLGACDNAESAAPLFELLRPEESGVTFVNELPESAELNILNYL